MYCSPPDRCSSRSRGRRSLPRRGPDPSRAGRPRRRARSNRTRRGPRRPGRRRERWRGRGRPSRRSGQIGPSRARREATAPGPARRGSPRRPPRGRVRRRAPPGRGAGSASGRRFVGGSKVVLGGESTSSLALDRSAAAPADVEPAARCRRIIRPRVFERGSAGTSIAPWAPPVAHRLRSGHSTRSISRTMYGWP